MKICPSQAGELPVCYFGSAKLGKSVQWCLWTHCFPKRCKLEDSDYSI